MLMQGSELVENRFRIHRMVFDHYAVVGDPNNNRKYLVQTVIRNFCNDINDTINDLELRFRQSDGVIDINSMNHLQTVLYRDLQNTNIEMLQLSETL